MKILFTVATPKQLYMHYILGKELKKEGHDVEYLIRNYGTNFVIADHLKLRYSSFGSNKYLGLAGKSKEIFMNDIEGIKKIRKISPDLILDNIFLGHPGLLLKIPSLAITDGDAKGILYIIYNFLHKSDAFIIPSHLDFNVNRPRITYPGFQEMIYLNNQHFDNNSPPDVIEALDSPYSIIRISQFGMMHDFNIFGLTEESLKDLIFHLEEYTNVYISSEKRLNPFFEKYLLKIPPYYIHNAIHNSSLFISETAMAVESALLGVPTIQLSPIKKNSGYPSYDDYSNFRFFRDNGLYRYYKVSEIDKIKKGIDDIMINHLMEKELLQRRLDDLYTKSIDVGAFLVWLIGNYPKSVNDYFKNRPGTLRKFCNHPKHERD